MTADNLTLDGFVRNGAKACLYPGASGYLSLPPRTYGISFHTNGYNNEDAPALPMNIVIAGQQYNFMIPARNSFVGLFTTGAYPIQKLTIISPKDAPVFVTDIALCKTEAKKTPNGLVHSASAQVCLLLKQYPPF